MAYGVPKEEYIAAVQKLDEETEGTPTLRKMLQAHEDYGGAYRSLFGTWHATLRAAGIQPTHGVTPEVSRDDLLNELQRLADELDKSPTQSDIIENGRYPSQLYQQEFKSFIVALEEAGITPTELQYRFSQVEIPEEKKTTRNIRYLRKNGPTPSSQLPIEANISDRRHGMWQFQIQTGSPPDFVCYLPEEHAPELVMRRFFAANPKVWQNKSLHGIKLGIRDHQKDWLDIAREFIDDLQNECVDAEQRKQQVVLIHTDKGDQFEHCVDYSVKKPVLLDDLDLSSETLSEKHPVWGFSREYKELWNRLTSGDILVFNGSDLEAPIAIDVFDLMQDWTLAKDLWAEYENGIRIEGPEVPWPYIVIGGTAQEIRSDLSEFALDPKSELDAIRLASEDELAPIIEKYGSFEAYLRDSRLRDDKSPNDNPTSPVEQRLADLMMPLSREPPLAVDDTKLEETERQVRSEAFRSGVNAIYSSCAICGRICDAPNGSTDLEAAHIYPKSESGPDILQNGLGLCPNHHWAFDAGWFAITEDYQIVVQNDSGLRGFEELNQFDEEKLYLPREEELYPHPKYLKAHRKLVDDEYR